MLLELHCHTAEHSPCSSVRAVDHVRQAVEHGMDGMVITDHHHLWSDADLADLHRWSAAPGEFVLLSGQEVYSREFHDLLVYGADRSYPVGTKAATIRRAYPGAALVMAHPFRWGAEPADRTLGHRLLDAVEVINGQQMDGENAAGLDAYERLRLVGTAGSDAHFRGSAGTHPTRFERPIRTMAELAAEIRAGRCGPASH
jgi:hypothetical protein